MTIRSRRSLTARAGSTFWRSADPPNRRERFAQSPLELCPGTTIIRLFGKSDESVQVGRDLAEPKNQLVIGSVAPEPRFGAQGNPPDERSRRDSARPGIRDDAIPLVIMVADVPFPPPRCHCSVYGSTGYRT